MWLPYVAEMTERTGLPEWAWIAIPLIFSCILLGTGGWLRSKVDNPQERWPHRAWAAADALINTFMALMVGAMILVVVILAVFFAKLH